MRRFRIDLHAHLVPPFYRAALRRAGVTRVAGTPFPSWTAPAAMRFMDRFGIQAQVVCISEPGVSVVAEDEAVTLARAVNDYEAELVAQYPTRFGALALLPLPQVEASLAELTHALDTLALDGVVLQTSYAGRSLGDPAFEPILAELDRRGAYVFVHPSAPAADDRPALPIPVFLYEFTFDTTRAVTDLLLSGAFTRHPRIRWQFAHAGGAIPALSERLAAYAQATTAPAGGLTREDVGRALARLYYDTALSPAPTAMAAVSEVTSFDHIVFGTDWPFAQALALSAGDPQPELSRSFSARERAAIERDHALALVPRLARALGEA